jgi:hypothetical protein
MANFFLQQPRLSYAQAVLPLFRTMLAGGVLAMLALLGGFVAPPPATLARPVPPARGPLIEAAHHPEWKQFLIQAAYRRADALEALRQLPDTPTIVPPDEPPVPTVAVQVADLPAPQAADALEDVTGPIPEPQAGEMTVEIGEASAIELPIEAFDVPVQGERPETFWQPATPAR